MVLMRFNPDGGVRAIVTRPSHFGEPQVLALTDVGLHPVLGLPACADAIDDVVSRVKLGSPLPLYFRSNGDLLAPYVPGEDDEYWRATCDPATGLVYVGTKATILQVELAHEQNIVTCIVGVPGEEESLDGSGASARVDRPFCMVADGHGNLLIKDCGANRVRLVRLPPLGSPPGAMSPGVLTLPHEYATNLWAMALDYAEPRRMYVATKTAVYRHNPLPYSIRGQSQPGTRPVAGQGAASLRDCGSARSHDGDRDHALTDIMPELLAGQEGDNARTDGVVASPPAAPPQAQPHLAAAAGGPLAGMLPTAGCGAAGAGMSAGRGGGPSRPSGGGIGSGSVGAGAAATGPGSSSARFGYITYMVVDAMGRLIIVEREPQESLEPILRIVWPSGLVTTFEADLEVTGSEFALAILPHGWLALHAWDGSRLQLLRLDPGLRPSLPPSCAEPLPAAAAAAAAAAAGGGATAMPGQPGLGGLADDLASLLSPGVAVASGGAAAGGDHDDDEEEEDAVVASDVAVVVGDRRFRCHRAILGARCEYFRRFFKSGFADSGVGQITLPDADPDAFALLLSFLYCSSLDIPPHLLRPAAELADRLLLPAASRHAQGELLAATCPSTVVDDLLWAEQHHFLDLLAGLKEFYMVHAHAVLEEAPDSLEVLMLRSPKLHLELYAAGIKRARRH